MSVKKTIHHVNSQRPGCAIAASKVGQAPGSAEHTSEFAQLSDHVTCTMLNTGKGVPAAVTGLKTATNAHLQHEHRTL